MSRIVVVTDSTVDFPTNLQNILKVRVVPLYVRFGEEEYRDRVDLSSDDFFAKLKKSEIMPATSQPTPDDFAKVYKEAGPSILSVHISAKLSGTFQSAQKAKEDMPDGFDIRLIDSQSFSLGLGFLVIKALQMAEDGEDLDAVEKKIKSIIPNLRLYGALDTLRYLEKGGRIGKASFLVGSLLQTKPIIQIRDGEVLAFETPRTKSKAMQRLKEIMAREGEMDSLGIIHAAAKEEAEELASKLKDIYPDYDIPVIQTGTIIGTHAGPGLVGIGGLLKKVGD